MVNYLLNLKLVNGDGKFSVNRQLAWAPNNGEKCVNTSTIRKFGAQNFRLRERSQSSVTLSVESASKKPIFTVMQ
jgi:hypothetical protein